MVYKATYTEFAERDIERLSKSESVKILKKMDFFLRLLDPFAKAKKLKNFDLPTYRFRIGDYRVIFRKAPDSKQIVVLVVLRVIRRKDAYK